MNRHNAEIHNTSLTIQLDPETGQLEAYISGDYADDESEVPYVEYLPLDPQTVVTEYTRRFHETRQRNQDMPITEVSDITIQKWANELLSERT